MKRWFGIRHVRYFWLAWRFSRFLRRCQEVGIGFFAQESDLKYLDDVWLGKK